MTKNLRNISVRLMLAAAVCLQSSPAIGGQAVRHALPIVIMMAPPTYPVFTRQAHIEGAVRLRITTDGRQVTNVQAEDNPSALLGGLAEKNVRTWQFEPGEPTTFTVAYTYKLATRPISGADSTSVTLELPTAVEISATIPVNADLAPDK